MIRAKAETTGQTTRPRSARLLVGQDLDLDLQLRIVAKTQGASENVDVSHLGPQTFQHTRPPPDGSLLDTDRDLERWRQELAARRLPRQNDPFATIALASQPTGSVSNSAQAEGESSGPEPFRLGPALR